MFTGKSAKHWTKQVQHDKGVNMPRYAFLIEYNGAPYFGWQRQKAHPSVQQTIGDALKKLDRDCLGVSAAGRTDKGVHATGQVAHCDMAKEWDLFRLTEALNFHLKPSPVAILQTAAVDDDWHARFSARERRYMFRLIARRAPLVHEAGLAWRVSQDLDVEAMRLGANRLLGTHDFTTFRSTMCQANSPIKTMDEARIEAHELDYGTEYRLYFRARSFLHNQIRSFVGTLERVGSGAWTPEDVTAAIEAKDRVACGPVCPPQGLYLSGVGYPEKPFGF